MATVMVGGRSVRGGLRSTRVLGFAVAAAVLSLAVVGFAEGAASRPAPQDLPRGLRHRRTTTTSTASRKRVGAHPAVLEDFYHWDTPLTSGALQRWRQTRTRGVLSLSTAPGGGPELISPRQIAKGQGRSLPGPANQSIAESKQVVYIRLFPEMNGSWNPYCAYNANGTKKDREPLDQQLPPRLAAHRADRPWRQDEGINRGAAPARTCRASCAASSNHARGLRARARSPAPRAPQGRLHVDRRRRSAHPAVAGQQSRAPTGPESDSSTGSAPTSTRSSRPPGSGRPSSTSTASGATPRSWSASTRPGTTTTAGASPASSSSGPSATTGADADLLPQRQPRHRVRHRRMAAGDAGCCATAEQATASRPTPQACTRAEGIDRD